MRNYGSHEVRVLCDHMRPARATIHGRNNLLTNSVDVRKTTVGNPRLTGYFQHYGVLS